MRDLVYEMREAVRTDSGRIAALITARELWLRARGAHSYGRGTAVLGLLGQPATNARVICLTNEEDDQILGCSVLLTTTPASPGWTAFERRERSWGMAMSHTHPDFRSDHIGWLMTMWVSDYAARQPDPPQWVRCRVPHRKLTAHYNNKLGWQLVRITTARIAAMSPSCSGVQNRARALRRSSPAVCQSR